jgi:Flp pilus assembly protein CpaB
MRRRAGLLLMLVGLVLASLAALLVLGMAQQSQQQSAQQIKQVYVVTAAKDIPEMAIISPEMLAVKAFPADFAPSGAVATVEEATGKYAASKLFKDTVLLRAQLTGTKKARDVASNLPPGKVAFWMPMPDFIASTGGLKVGDRVDVLLTVNFNDITGGSASSSSSGVSGDSKGKWFSTQTTLQNVEVFAVGTVDQAVESGATAAPGASSPTAALRSSGGNDKRAIVLLVDHQDAVILKFIKDTEKETVGLVDLVLRSADDAQIVRTDSMAPESLVDRFKFRVPSQMPAPATSAPAPRT